MSSFIVPLSSLPTISSITDVKGKQGAAAATGAGQDFASVFQDAFKELSSAGEVAQQGTYSLAMGGSDDLHTGAIDALKYSTAVSYTSGLASRAIQSYNELMRMQI